MAAIRTSDLLAVDTDAFRVRLRLEVGVVLAALASLAKCNYSIIAGHLLSRSELVQIPYAQAVMMWSIVPIAVSCLCRHRERHGGRVALILDGFAAPTLIVKL